MDCSKIGFVVGLAAEARLLRGAGFMVGIGGGMPAGAELAANELIDKGAGALISFGLAGGLNPGLFPGSVIVPGAVSEVGVVFQCDPELTDWLGGATANFILAGVKIAVTAAQKSALFAQTGSDAIDLESGAVARAAAAHNIPFAVLRAVADPAARNLPPAALIALNASGKISLTPILASIFQTPSQIPALIALAGDAGKARKALAKRLQIL